MNFKEEPCGILMGNGGIDDEAYLTATTFVPTMRMKKWKPKSGSVATGLDKSREYCYMDYDSNLTDYWFQWPNEQACDRDLFRGNPAIADVFVDDKMDMSRSFPFKKCVFAVDKKAATDSNLSTFWNTVNDVDCKALYAWAQASNAILNKDVLALANEIVQKKLERTQALAVVNEKKTKIDELNTNINRLNDQIVVVENINDGLAKQVITTTTAIDSTNILFRSTYASCNATMNLLGSQIIEIDNNIVYATDYLAAYTNSNNVTEGQSNLILQNYIKDTAAYSNMWLQWNAINFSNNELVNRLNDEIDAYNKCNNTLIRTQASYVTCQSNMVKEWANNALYISNLTTCQTNYGICSAALASCLDNKAYLKGINNGLIIQYQKCTDSLYTCLSRQAQLVGTSNDLSASITEWMRTHFICSQISLIDSLKTSIDATLNTCRVGDIVSYDNALNNAIGQRAQDAADQLNSCVLDTNTIFTSMPPKQESPTIPPAADVPFTSMVTRYVTCAPSPYVDDYCATTSTNYCATMLPGKSATLDESLPTVNISGTRLAYPCKYMPPHTDDLLEDSDNAWITKQAYPNIYIIAAYRMEEATGGCSKWYACDHGFAFFFITSYTFLQNPGDRQYSNRDSTTAYTDNDNVWNTLVTINPVAVSLPSPNTLQIGTSTIDFSKASYGVGHGTNGMDWLGIWDLDKLKLAPLVSTNDWRPLKSRTSSIIVYDNSRNPWPSDYPMNVWYDCNAHNRADNVGGVLLPYGSMMVCYSEMDEAYGAHLAHVGPGIFFGLNAGYGVKKFILANTISFNDTWIARGTETYKVDMSKVEYDKVYLIPPSRCLLLPYWVHIEVLVLNNDKYISDATKKGWWFKPVRAFDYHDRPDLEMQYITHYDKPGVYMAGSVSNGREQNQGLFYYAFKLKKIPGPNDNYA